MQKQPSFHTMCSLLIKTRHICADTQLRLWDCSSCTELAQDRTLCTEGNGANNEGTSSLQLEGTQSQQPQTERLSSALLASRAGLAAQLCSLPQWHRGFLLSRATKLPPRLCAGYPRLIQTLLSHFCLNEGRIGGE